MDKKTMRFIAGALFAVNGLLRLTSLSGGFWSLLWVVGFVLVAVSLFIDQPMLTLAGGAVLVLALGRNVFVNLRNGFFVPFLVVELVAFVLLAVAGASRSASKLLSILSAGCYVLYLVLMILGNGVTPTLKTILYAVLFVAGAVLLGLAFSEEAPKAAAAQGFVPQGAAPQSELSEKLDRLIRFKDLMDRGVITPEEFEAKKREVLG